MIKNKVTKLNTFEINFKSDLNLLLRNDQKTNLDIYNTVQNIIKKIQDFGDKALLDLVRKYDGIKVNKIKELKISQEQLKLAYTSLNIDEKQALELSANRIKSFHQRQIPTDLEYQDDIKVDLGLKYSPVSSAGFYVPGGKAIYPSSVLMNAIPANVAGVERRVVVSPISDLNKSKIVLAAAYIAGVTDFICMGGAHAIAALAHGTESIDKVDKIVGPGNAYVAEAKRQLFGKVGIDSIAGPSEVLIVCDRTANPDHVAIDLLSQAEHDEQAQAILITDSKEIALKVEVCVQNYLKDLKRSKIASASWYSNGAIIIVRNIDEAIELVNFIAPEHLELIFKNAKQSLNKIKNAGAIFIGHNTPEAIGDYIAGPNHVLPTNGTAKFSSGLGVLDFYKRTTIVNCNKESLGIIGKHAITLAKAEGLEAHAMSIALRIKN
ncbi:histidinol dehydrogenase [Alphaproteobacteria bacterium]|nr:histidinol dehydrogenase [Alphaproteobacteria bacterium]